MKNSALSVLALASALTLSACGGGGGSSPATPHAPPSPPVVTASPYPVPIPSAPAGQAAAGGRVVDFASNAPLGGVTVSLAAYTSGAAATGVATTQSDGTFSFTVSPGTYLLVIGDNASTDTRTTLHARIDLAQGANRLLAPVPPSEQNVTPLASQLAGDFRLTSLAGDQLDCFQGANTGRSNLGLPALIPDEYATETAYATATQAVAQDTDTPTMFRAGSYAYAAALGTTLSGLTDEENFQPCSAWTGPNYAYVSGNPPYPYATDRANIWYGAAILPARSVQINYGQQTWAKDPRV